MWTREGNVQPSGTYRNILRDNAAMFVSVYCSADVYACQTHRSLALTNPNGKRMIVSEIISRPVIQQQQQQQQWIQHPPQCKREKDRGRAFNVG